MQDCEGLNSDLSTNVVYLISEIKEVLTTLANVLA